MSFAESVGKAIPDEISKTSSWTRWIPYIGPFLQAIGQIDRTATAYADTNDVLKEAGVDKKKRRRASWQNAFNEATNFNAGDPGRYGSPPESGDWMEYAGQAGNLFSAAKSGNAQGALGNIQNIYGEATRDTNLVEQQYPQYFGTPQVQYQDYNAVPYNAYYAPNPGVRTFYG